MPPRDWFDLAAGYMRVTDARQRGELLLAETGRTTLPQGFSVR